MELPSLYATTLTPSDLASQYSLTASTTFPFPTSTQSASNTQTFLVDQWFLNRNRIQNGGSDLQFVDDPFPDGSSQSQPVLQVIYPEDSFSHDTGGAQFINMWNNTEQSAFQSMALTYDIAFDKDFPWVKGGKLPGIRGGNDTSGCSGGNEPTGSECFSVRLMWRTDGVGEAYAYIPSPNGLCSERSIICNSDFGISISRGAFSFTSGQWNRITLLVQLNDPVDVANGNLQVYYNDLLLISQQDLQFRSSPAVSANGMYFSTFFGGSDDSWATPQTTHTYFRNIQLWGGSNPSTLSGRQVQNMASKSSTSFLLWFLPLVAFVIFL
ncbi:polysaccharide lyase family 14 protein [Dendrothele bispora CBS 962.96]|uniref:Polysaccharide lyase family 14 protein n=1 Tax=Dendrothele bispora (strain CBS 962.96) TaxID=1314807 RepID=A0A4S8MQF3_DENBC|nr:polysaccharide lyase family 14 protein [Dendrothele bispora CBS 962.96]